jgi:hypothetical protein
MCTYGKYAVITHMYVCVAASTRPPDLRELLNHKFEPTYKKRELMKNKLSLQYKDEA